MRKILIITAALTLLLVGCAQDVEPTVPQNTTGSVENVTEPSQKPADAPTTPSEPEADSTEGAMSSEPTEAPAAPEVTEPIQEQPRQVTADELKSLMKNKFMFGDKGLLGKPAYVWYPQGIAEMQFKYNGIHYYARAYEGYADIACWNHPWVKPYGESDDLPGLTGQVRRCKIDDIVYTSILWYDEERNLTFTLDWTGGKEDYITFVSIIFLDKLNDYIIPIE